MIRNTERTSVESTPEHLWDQYIRPDKIEQILPSVQNVKNKGRGTYEAEMVITRFNFHMGVVFETKTKNRPEKLELTARYPDFTLIAELTQTNGVTDVELTAILDLPPGIALVGEDQIAEELDKRMADRMNSLKQEVTENNE